jgi:hypothetical protein
MSAPVVPERKSEVLHSNATDADSLSQKELAEESEFSPEEQRNKDIARIQDEIAKLDFNPPPANMALSRVPGDDELYIGGYVFFTFTLHTSWLGGSQPKNLVT